VQEAKLKRRRRPITKLEERGFTMEKVLEAIRSELQGATQVRDLVAQRIYPDALPSDAALPAVVLRRIPPATIESAQGEDHRIRIDCYAQRYMAAHEVAEAVDAVLADTTRPEFSIWRHNARDVYENRGQVHHVQLDFSVWE
jgi:hypothetical protein